MLTIIKATWETNSKQSYLSKVVVMWGRYRGDKHSHGYRDPSGCSRGDGSFGADVAHTVMGVTVGVVEGSGVHWCMGYLSIIHTAVDQGLARIEHCGAHESTSLTISMKQEPLVHLSVRFLLHGRGILRSIEHPDILSTSTNYHNLNVCGLAWRRIKLMKCGVQQWQLTY